LGNSPAAAAPGRLLSLDAFRGATVAAMLLVNNPGSWSDVYPPLLHAPWHGWTFTDLIFPFFLWIVGVAMTLSFAKRAERGDTPGRIFRHVVTRSAIIFAIGIFLAAFPFGLLSAHHFSLATLRIPGVLQRIAVCYLLASAITLHTTWRGQVGWIVALLAGYWLLVMLVPVPGYGAGVLEPTGSLAWYLDSTLLAGHTWSGAPAPGFDPEGILSTVPAVATTLFGVLAGNLLRTRATEEAKTAWLFVGGETLLLAGVIMNHWLPINKNLWTSSYAVFMAGWATVVLATCYWFIDVKGYRRWAHPFVVYGMNAIVIFALSGIVAKLLYLVRWTGADGASVTLKGFIYDGLFTPVASPVNASLFFAIAFVLAGWLAAWGMWRRGWFVRI
jgi:predicted acyltransferase